MGNTAQFESLRSIHAHYRWGLTGTPPTRDLSQVAEPFRTEAEKAAEMLVGSKCTWGMLAYNSCDFTCCKRVYVWP